MHDFESFEEGGTRFYAGIFREGTDGRAAWFTADWNEFNQKWTEWEAAGLRLHDFEFFDEGGTWVHGGIYRQGTGGHYGWFGADWENFRSFWHEREKENFRLDDVEVYPSACSNTCMNQVILPAPDWYDYMITRTADHCPGLPGTCSVPANSTVVYRAPFYEEGGQRYVQLSSLLAIDPIFTLPFNDTDITHNGWLYSPGSWHHAIDYANGKNFNVRAAAPGEVIFVGWDVWSGGTVILSHEAGGEADRYRTIYMHLLNGAEADCNRAWTMTVPWMAGIPDLASEQANFTSYLTDTGCNQNGSGVPQSGWWGTNGDTVPVSVGDFVQRGEILGKAGSTGPGGCGCATGGSGPNHHLHIFFARRDPVNDNWYFFDPYGIYGPTECYPTRNDAEGASSATPCARYPVAWLGGRPQLSQPPAQAMSFKRGDSNQDGTVNISDPINLLGCKFLGTECGRCEDAADSNDDGKTDIADAVFVLNCLFQRACPQLALNSCLPDRTTSDGLGCREYQPCERRG
jgi:murein DD-endopeptidase MepM/ murein hydrolase activator NlpD